jgi:hypothetical protein
VLLLRGSVQPKHKGEELTKQGATGHEENIKKKLQPTSRVLIGIIANCLCHTCH